MEKSEMLVGAITGGVIEVVLLPLFMKLKKMAAAFEKIDFMLPKTLKQRIKFLFFPWRCYLLFHVPIWVIGIAGAITFGLALVSRHLGHHFNGGHRDVVYSNRIAPYSNHFTFHYRCKIRFHAGLEEGGRGFEYIRSEIYRVTIC